MIATTPEAGQTDEAGHELRVAAPARAARLSAWDAAIVLVGAVYAIVYAWPASVQPWQYVWGSHGDALGNAFEFDWAAGALHQGRPLTIDHQVAWPFGDPLGSLPHEPLFRWVALGLSWLIGAVPTMNLLSLLPIPLTAWLAYRLALRVAGSRPAAFVAGVAYGCSTYLLENSRGEPTLAQAWVFPLAALALLAALSRPRPLSVLGAALAIVVAATVNFYFALFASLMAVALAGSWLVLTALFERRLPVRPLLAAVTTGVLALAVAGAMYVTTSGNLRAQAAGIVRPVSQLTNLEVTPLDFVLPPRNSPWFGAPRQQIVDARLQRTGSLVDLAEVEIPLPVLVLAPLGLLLVLWGLFRGRKRPVEAGALVGVSLLGLWLVVPPDALPRRSLALQWDVYRLVPAFQAYHRAVLLIALGACVLTAILLARVLPRRALYSIPIVAVLAGAILAENFYLPADRVLDVSTPPEYAWIVAHPGDYAIAEYPLFTNDADGNQWTYDFNTRYQPHPEINGHISDDESASMRVELEDPNRPGVATKLATLGVRYLIWHQDLAGVKTAYTGTPRHSSEAYRPQSPAYVQEASFPDQSVIYSINAPPAQSVAFYAAGFSGIAQGTGRWMLGTTGQLDVYDAGGGAVDPVTVQCRAGTGNPVLTATAGGTRLGSWQLSTDQPLIVNLEVPVQAGVTRVQLAASGSAGPDGLAFCTLPGV